MCETMDVLSLLVSFLFSEATLGREVVGSGSPENRRIEWNSRSDDVRVHARRWGNATELGGRRRERCAKSGETHGRNSGVEPPRYKDVPRLRGVPIDDA